jgi:hypothetical protein
MRGMLFVIGQSIDIFLNVQGKPESALSTISGNAFHESALFFNSVKFWSYEVNKISCSKSSYFFVNYRVLTMEVCN